jgi:DMSO/TMAO reductase YedYZ heme-binding membrane subunit
MSATSKTKQLEGWTLFAWVTGLTSVAVLLLATTVDLSTGPGTVSMIRTSVRLSAPWVLLAFAASSLLALFPNELTRWLMRNRRMFGLCFAAAMGWQLVFITWMLVGHWDFYIETIHPAGALPSRLAAYAILLAMTVTSFAAPRRRIGPKAWSVLHKLGIYSMWLAIWSSYTEALFVEENPPVIAYVYAATGFAAWMLRIAAFAQQRVSARAPRGSEEAQGRRSGI